ncbi:NCS1 family nucleobase:cation symporter-1 [Streptomyces sp. NPDC056165]|uniref:NCS1 family nucleobase:cation symporter-1 n=1 Tax=Streptomyces sp. NPDC056165 TaxID=3345733 RepID=UPI0035D974A0
MNHDDHAPDALHEGTSKRLHNEDLAPAVERHWRFWDLFCLWMSATHSLGGFATAASLFVLGLNGWQVFLALLLGNMIVYAGFTLTGVAGQRTGVPFAVFSRLSLGVFGGRVAALLRAMLAVFWYGIQTYLASAAIAVIILKLVPAAGGWEHVSLLGLSPVGLFAFLFMWSVQLFVLRRGMETVRKFIDFCGPMIWVALLSLAVWIVVEAHGKVSLTLASAPKPLGGSSWFAFVSATLLVVGYSAVPITNFADFSRFMPNTATIVKGNFVAAPLNQIAFALVSVITITGTVTVFGAAVTNPIEIVQHFSNPLLLVCTVAIFAVATMGINVVANFVSPAYDFSSLAPSRISFRTGGVITALLALLVMPWKIFGNAHAVNIFNGFQGAVAGPLLGILLVDYYVCRRGFAVVDDLFREDKQGLYFYHGGVHWAGIATLTVSTVLLLPLTLVPGLSLAAPFAWPIGLVLGGGGYYLATRSHFAAHRAVAERAAAVHTEGEPA